MTALWDDPLYVWDDPRLTWDGDLLAAPPGLDPRSIHIAFAEIEVPSTPGPPGPPVIPDSSIHIGFAQMEIPDAGQPQQPVENTTPGGGMVIRMGRSHSPRVIDTRRGYDTRHR